MKLWFVALSFSLMSCNPTGKQAVTGGLDGANATCQAVEQQTSNDWIDLTCTLIGVADGVAHTFPAKAPRQKIMAAANCSGAKP